MHIPRSHRLRIGRVSLRNGVYLCTAKTIDREPLFHDLFAGRLVVRALKGCDDQGLTDTFAFVVMPDHFHWLFQLVGTDCLSAIVRRAKSTSAREVNRHLRRDRPVWQPGFHDHGVRTEESLMEIGRYVVLNPVRGGLVRSLRAYALWDAKWVR